MTNATLLNVTDRPAEAAFVGILPAENTVIDAAAVAQAPVFVDATGRRARWLRMLGVLVFLAFALYLGMVLSGVVGSSVDLSTAMPHVTATATAIGSAS